MVPVAYRAQAQTYVPRTTARTNVARAIEDGRSMLLFMRPHVHAYIYILDYANAGHASDGNADIFLCFCFNFFSIRIADRALSTLPMKSSIR